MFRTPTKWCVALLSASLKPSSIKKSLAYEKVQYNPELNTRQSRHRDQNNFNSEVVLFLKQFSTGAVCNLCSSNKWSLGLTWS